MTAFSDYLEDALLNETLKNVNYVPAATIYVGLHTASPTDTGSLVTEVSGGSYARTAIVFGAVAAGAVANSALVTFPTATASWGIVTHFGLWDTSGNTPNLLYHGALTVQKTVDSGDIFTIPIGNLTVTLQ